MLIQLRTLTALLLLMMLCTKSIFQLAPTNLWQTPLLNPDEVTWQVESHAPKICQDTIGTSHVVRFLALANPIAQHMWLLWLLAFQCWGLMPRCLCDARPQASTNQWKATTKMAHAECWCSKEKMMWYGCIVPCQFWYHSLVAPLNTNIPDNLLFYYALLILS